MRGSKPGERRGGRKKGSLNKSKSKLAAKIETMEAAAAAGETPMEYMLRVMRDPTVDHERRDRLAASVAPYVHAKLASVTVAGDPNKPLNIIHRVERVIVSSKSADGSGVRTTTGTEPV